MKNMEFKSVANNSLARELYNLDARMLCVKPTSLSQECNLNIEEFLYKVKTELVKECGIRITATLILDYVELVKKHTFQLPIEGWEETIDMETFCKNIFVHAWGNPWGEINGPLYGSGSNYALLDNLQIDQHPEFVTLFEKWKALKEAFNGYWSGHFTDFDFSPVSLEGRFSKRFGKKWQDLFGFKLTDSQISQIGNWYNIFQYPNDADKEYHVRITNNLNWEDGQYGKDDSCWWGMYHTSRDTFYWYGGMGLLFYPSPDYDDHEDGYARVWIAPLEGDKFVVYNAYGVELREGAAIVANILQGISNESWKYGKRKYYNDCDGNIPYINGNNAYVIYKSCENVSHDEIHVDMHEKKGIFDYGKKCSNCGGHLDDHEIWVDSNSNIYCEQCYHSMYFTCDSCGNEFDNDDMRIFEDSDNCTYCPDCHDARVDFYCVECNGSFRYTRPVLDEDGDEYCPDCANAVLHYCDEHGFGTYECEECANNAPSTDGGN